VPEKQFVLQLSGWNGSGKSTLARAVGKATGAVVLDHDVTKTAILEGGTPHPPAGMISYDVIFGLAHDLLAQGHSVIIDSPCAYDAILSRGIAAAGATVSLYKFAECMCPVDVAAARVDSRVPMSSQVKSAAEAAVVAASGGRTLVRPEGRYLRVDTTRSVDECVADVVAYLREPVTPSP
jgi:predicted kinase